MKMISSEYLLDLRSVYKREKEAAIYHTKRAKPVSKKSGIAASSCTWLSVAFTDNKYPMPTMGASIT